MRGRGGACVGTCPRGPGAPASVAFAHFCGVARPGDLTARPRRSSSDLAARESISIHSQPAAGLCSPATASSSPSDPAELLDHSRLSGRGRWGGAGYTQRPLTSDSTWGSKRGQAATVRVLEAPARPSPPEGTRTTLRGAPPPSSHCPTDIARPRQEDAKCPQVQAKTRRGDLVTGAFAS